MKKGLWGLSTDLDTMLKNRIFIDGSVDAVLQGEAVLLDPSNIEVIYQAPIAEKWGFKKLNDTRPLLKTISKQILDKSADKLDYLYNLVHYTSNMANIFPIKHQPNNRFYPSPDDYFWGALKKC